MLTDELITVRKGHPLCGLVIKYSKKLLAVHLNCCSLFSRYVCQSRSWKSRVSLDKDDLSPLANYTTRLMPGQSEAEASRLTCPHHGCQTAASGARSNNYGAGPSTKPHTHTHTHARAHTHTLVERLPHGPHPSYSVAQTHVWFAVEVSWVAEQCFKTDKLDPNKLNCSDPDENSEVV